MKTIKKIIQRTLDDLNKINPTRLVGWMIALWILSAVLIALVDCLNG